MEQQLILCVPGPWENSADLVQQTITLDPPGSYMFAARMIVHPAGNDHVPLELYPRDENMTESFRIAGQGSVSPELLEQINSHRGVAYLRFPIDLLEHRERILKFSKVLQRLGGYGIKVESSGTAHNWERWFELLSGDDFQIYCSVVTLIADSDFYYSCGMHHFGLPESAVSREFSPAEAAEMMNQFNFWRVIEKPELESGHTFSADEESPRLRMQHSADHRHEVDDLFHNPHGIWNLRRA